MDSKLKGKTVLIAGASRNMGRVAALMFAQEGANLSICTSAKMKELNAVAEEARGHGATVLAEQCDVTDGDAVAAFVEKARGRFGGVDVAICLPGYRCEGDFLEISFDSWSRSIDINLTGPFHICRNVLPLMKERGWGRIINVSGLASFNGASAAKAMVKLGIVGFTRGIAREFGPYNITANCVAPGSIVRSHEPGIRENPLRSVQPIQRKGRPEDVVALMVYLASEDAGFITGQCYSANGGAYFQ